MVHPLLSLLELSNASALLTQQKLRSSFSLVVATFSAGSSPEHDIFCGFVTFLKHEIQVDQPLELLLGCRTKRFSPSANSSMLRNESCGSVRPVFSMDIPKAGDEGWLLYVVEENA